jgi:hypothetical protein
LEEPHGEGRLSSKTLNDLNGVVARAIIAHYYLVGPARLVHDAVQLILEISAAIISG